MAARTVPPPDMVKEWVSPLMVEFIGALALTFMGAGAIIMTHGNNLVAIGLAHGLAIGLMIAATGHISGGLFNPAVAVGLAIGRVISPKKMVAFIIVELIGAVVAALLLKAVFPATWIDAVGFGTPGVGGAETAIVAGHTAATTFPAFSVGRAFVAEIILSFFLMYAIYGVAVDKRGPATIAGLVIGLIITMDIFANGAVSGAAMNPSRHFGVALIGNHWDNWWIWYVAPTIGMAIAAFIYRYIYMADVPFE